MPYLNIFNFLIGIVIISTVYFWICKTKTKLIYFYSPKCRHCRDFMPIWDSINMPPKIGKKKINCDIEDCTGIQALPTIRINDKEFTGERTKENVELFVKQNV